ncbi:MAG: SagB/ThcOx family dehydrogenase [Methanomassiliicoccales archaeon]
MKAVEKHREFLKQLILVDVQGLRSDQQRGVPPPPLQKPCPENLELVDLVPPDELSVGNMPLIDVVRKRRSHRQYSEESLTKEELSFLLWATQGVRSVSKENVHTLRTVPSAGARHPLETYIVVNHVYGLRPGLYRHLPLYHKLCFLSEFDPGFKERLIEATMGQSFVAGGAVVFIWTVIPYRSEWRYLTRAHKVSALDAGHVCQNLYLASESIGAGTCAVAAYDQGKMDVLLGVDGNEEFTIYLAPVGKIKQGKKNNDS